MPLDQPQSSVGICSFALGEAGKCLNQLLIRFGDRIWGHLKSHSWERSRAQKGPGALSHFFPPKNGIIWAGKDLKSIEFQAHPALYCPKETEIKIGDCSPWESQLFGDQDNSPGGFQGKQQLLWGSESFVCGLDFCFVFFSFT